MRPDPMTEWVGLELRHLAALRAIADEGSFKGAARLLGYTPSAISQQIASLERIVGTEVIAREQGAERSGRRRRQDPPQPPRCHRGAPQRREDRRRGARSGLQRPPAHRRIRERGVRILPDVIRRFRASHPKVRIEVVDATIDLDLLRSLERGVLDLAFTTPPIPSGPFESRTILHDPWVLVAGAGLGTS